MFGRVGKLERERRVFKVAHSFLGWCFRLLIAVLKYSRLAVVISLATSRACVLKL